MSENQPQEPLLCGCKCMWSPHQAYAPLHNEDTRMGHSYLPPTAVTSYETLFIKLFLNLNALIIQRGDLEQTVASLSDKIARGSQGEMQLGMDLRQVASQPLYRCRYGKCDAEQPTLLQYLLQLVQDYPAPKHKFHALLKIYLDSNRSAVGELLESFNNMLQVDFFTPTYNFKYLKQLLAQQRQLCRNLLFLWYCGRAEFRQGLAAQLQQLEITNIPKRVITALTSASCTAHATVGCSASSTNASSSTSMPTASCSARTTSAVSNSESATATPNAWERPELAAYTCVDSVATVIEQQEWSAAMQAAEVVQATTGAAFSVPVTEASKSAVAFTGEGQDVAVGATEARVAEARVAGQLETGSCVTSAALAESRTQVDADNLVGHVHEQAQNQVQVDAHPYTHDHEHPLPYSHPASEMLHCCTDEKANSVHSDLAQAELQNDKKLESGVGVSAALGTESDAGVDDVAYSRLGTESESESQASEKITAGKESSECGESQKPQEQRQASGFSFDGDMVHMEITPEFLMELCSMLQQLNQELICNWRYYHVAQGTTHCYLSDIKNVRHLWTVRAQGYLTSYVLLRLYSIEANPQILANDALIITHLQHIIDSLVKLQSVFEVIDEVSHELRLDLHKLAREDYAQLEHAEQAQLMLQYASQYQVDEIATLWDVWTQKLARLPSEKSALLNSTNPQIQNLLYRVFAAVYNAHVSPTERKFKDRNRKLSERIYLSKQAKQRVQDCLDIVRELVSEVRSCYNRKQNRKYIVSGCRFYSNLKALPWGVLFNVMGNHSKRT